MVEFLTRDRRAAGSSLTGVTVLCSLSKNIYPSLVLVQPRKTRPFITERLLMRRKESNQTNKQTNSRNKVCHKGTALYLKAISDYDENFTYNIFHDKEREKQEMAAR